MQILNTKLKYGVVAKFFHWTMSIILIGMVCVGFYMTQESLGDGRFKLYDWHKSFGLLILFMAMFRIVWKIGNPAPLFSDKLANWQKLAAQATHWAFYVFMFALPLSGWLMSSAGGHEVRFFNLFTLPALLEPNKALAHQIHEIHEYLAYGLIATFALHIAALIKHEWIDKDPILKKML